MRLFGKMKFIPIDCLESDLGFHNAKKTSRLCVHFWSMLRFKILLMMNHVLLFCTRSCVCLGWVFLGSF